MDGMGFGKHMGHGMHMGGPMKGEMGGPMWMHGMGMCPYCGMGLEMMGKGHPHMGPMGIAKKAKKKILIEKVKAKLEQKYGDELDKAADLIVGMAEDRVRMIAEDMKRFAEMKKMMAEFLAEEEEEG